MFFAKISSSPTAVNCFARLAGMKQDEALRLVETLLEHGPRRVVLLDQPTTPALEQVVLGLHRAAVEVVVIDHHQPVEIKTDRDHVEEAVATRLADLSGVTLRRSTRVAAPAISDLIEVGEFADEDTVLLTDFDLDGLLGAMCARGIWSDELAADAAVLDGPRCNRTANSLSKLGYALSLLEDVLDGPQDRKEADRTRLYERFAAAVAGNEEARQGILTDAELVGQLIDAANMVAKTAAFYAGGRLVSIDLSDAPRLHRGTLYRHIERGGVEVVATTSKRGEIADLFGAQVRFSRTREATLDLRDFIPDGVERGAEHGLLYGDAPFWVTASPAVAEQIMAALIRYYEG